MTKLYLKRNTFNTLEADMETDLDIIKRLPQGETLEYKVRKPRNLQFHRKFFALIQIVFDNQEKYDNLTDLLVEIKLKTGHYQEHITTKQQIVYVPKSISFEKMDNIEFEKFYEKTIEVVLKHFLTGNTREEIDFQVAQIMDFT